MHWPLFLKHFEHKEPDTVLVRPPALTFTCSRRGQSIPELNVLKKGQTWAGMNAKKEAQGVCSAVLPFLPNLQEEEGRNDPCPGQTQNKRKGGTQMQCFC